MAKVEIKAIYDKGRQHFERTCGSVTPRMLISEETGDEVIIVKDKHGKVIGFEKLNFYRRAQGFQKKSIPIKASLS